MQRPRSSLLRWFPFLLGILSAILFSTWTLPSPSEARDTRTSVHKKKLSKKKDKKRDARKIKPGVQAKAVYCIDIAGNQVLMARDPDKQLPVASLTKLMTAMVVLKHMPLDRKLEVSSDIKGIPKSVVGLRPGDVVAVKDLLHGMLMGSGNDCAESLAAAFKGGPEGLVEEMNKKARAMGTHRTVFYTASGLDKKTPEKKDSEGSVKIDSNMSTAREMAQIARAAFSDETIRSICQKRTHVISDTKSGHTYTVRNTNKLLRDSLPIEGGKTGFTCRAGHCLASKFAAGGRALLIVVLGSPDHFRDTRLVYRKAMEKGGAPDIKHGSRPTRHAQKGSKEFGG